MVDPDQILALFHKHFETTNAQVVVNDQGLVDVLKLPDSRNTVVYMRNHQLTKLPVAFGRVEGNLDASRQNIKTLKNFPQVITGNLYTEDNRNLRQFYDFNIKEIQGVWYTDYKESQHLLKMLVAHNIQLTDAPKEVTQIMNTHAGKGRTGILRATVELIKAGFKENARW
jgi:hypothetical protein